MYKRNNQGWLKHIDFILWDAACLQLAFIFAYLIRMGGSFPYDSDSYRNLALILFVVDILVAAIFNTMHNVMKRGYYQEAVQTIKHVLLVFLVITLALFSTQSGDVFSRVTLYLTTLFHLIIGYGIRLAWKSVLQNRGREGKKTSMLLVAEERDAREALAQLSSHNAVEYTGIVLSDRDGTGRQIRGVPVVASLETAADYICRQWIDEVLVFPSQMTDMEVLGSELYRSSEAFINDSYAVFAKKEYDIRAEGTSKKASVTTLIEACRQMSIPVHIRLPISNIGVKTFVEKIGGYTVLTTASNYASPLQLAVKRAMDIVGGIAGSLIALVVIAILGPKIKRESPGPILFKQTRIGKNGKRFQMLKIRSMYVNADERKAELMKQNRVSDGMMFKLDWDPRIIGNKIVDGKQVTGIGQRIRDGSWDEWPQFFNILKGDMSLVGTRPPTVDEWEKYKYHHRARLATRPGLTGMWQVSGRSKITDFEEVVKLDTEYINHWSIGLDIRILLKTVKAVFTKDGAM